MQHLEFALRGHFEQRAVAVGAAAGRGADHAAIGRQAESAIGLRAVGAAGEGVQTRIRAVRRDLEDDAVAMDVSEIGGAIDVSGVVERDLRAGIAPSSAPSWNLCRIV